MGRRNSCGYGYYHEVKRQQKVTCSIIKRSIHWEMNQSILIAPEMSLHQNNVSVFLLGIMILLYFIEAKGLKWQKTKFIKPHSASRKIFTCSYVLKSKVICLMSKSAQKSNKFHCNVIYHISSQSIFIKKKFNSDKNPVAIVKVLLLVFVPHLLIMAGDVELNPGPYKPELLANLMKDFHQVAPKFFDFGIQLQISIDKIKSIQLENNNDTRGVLTNIFDYWLNNTPEDKQFSILCNALAFIERNDLVNVLKSKYSSVPFEAVLTTPVMNSTVSVCVPSHGSKFSHLPESGIKASQTSEDYMNITQNSQDEKLTTNSKCLKESAASCTDDMVDFPTAELTESLKDEVLCKNKLLANLMKDFSQVAAKSLNFGIQLGISLDKITSIQIESIHDNETVLAKIFDHWLNNTSKDEQFSILCNALESINRADLVNVLKSNYSSVPFKAKPVTNSTVFHGPSHTSQFSHFSESCTKACQISEDSINVTQSSQDEKLTRNSECLKCLKENTASSSDDDRPTAELPDSLKDKDIIYDVLLESYINQTVEYCENLSLVAGGGGTGKSHLVAMCLKREPPSLRISTPCAISSPLAMKVYGVTSSHLLLSPETYTKMMMQSVNPADLSYLSAGYQRKSPISSTTASSTHSDIDLHLLSLTFLKGVDSLHGKVLGRIVNIGGQPQLLELLPRFTNEISLGIVVTDLSQNLADYPISYFYGEDGKSVGEGIKSNLTNEQIIRVFLQMLIAQSTKLKKIKIMIIGTHRDVEHKSKEKRKQKEAKLLDIITSFGLKDNIVYTDGTHSKVIFAVNALHPEEEDRAIGQKIMELTMDEKNSQHISIPIKHHCLELTLKKLSASKKIAIPIGEVLHHVRHYYQDDYDLREGLLFLHRSFRIFYFKEFPILVFGEPQLLLNFMTKVTVHHIKLTTNTKLGEAITGSWKKFTKYGIITEDILMSISDVFDETFTPAVMVEVMEKLQIVCKIGDGEYLMPSLLPALASLPRSKPSTLLRWLPFGLGNISGLKSDVTMLLHFPCGLVRFGIYCGTICELISNYNWKLAGPISRNRFFFIRPHSAGTVALIDSFDTFLMVNLDVPSDISLQSLACMCSDVRDTIQKAITTVTRELRYVEDQPAISFICKHHYSTPHAAEYIPIDEHLLCTKDNSVINHLEDNHRLWLGDAALPEGSKASGTSQPHCCQTEGHTHITLEILDRVDSRELCSDDLAFILYEVGSRMETTWQQFVVRLGLKQETVRYIWEDNRGICSLCLQSALHSWLTLNYNYEVHGKPSWRKIAEAIKDLDPDLSLQIAETHGKEINMVVITKLSRECLSHLSISGL